MSQKAIVVVGMHRSGTSAISGLLAELGVFMGSSLFAPQEGVNEKGFFENSLLVDINDRLLDESLLSWDHPLALTLAGEQQPHLSAYQNEAKLIIEKDYRGKLLWGMKDPRTSLLLPFWLKTFKDLNVSANFIIMLRHPMEVFGSLKKRDGFSLQKVMHLWLNYTLSSYFGSLQQPSVILRYEDLLNTPETCAKRIFETFSLGELDSLASQSFIDKKLQNQHSINVPNDRLVNLAMTVYLELGKSVIDHNAVVKASEEYQAHLHSLSSVLVEHLNAVKKEEVYFKHHFLNAYESIWWKLSWPLKKIESFFSPGRYRG